MPAISGGTFVVVGGASLLGSHIGEQSLAGDAREVVLLDNLALGSTENIDFLLLDPRCTFVRGDALRLNELYDPMANADGVFAVAGFLGKPMLANPWGRLARPEEVASASLMLLSDAASFVHGVMMPVDGGLMAGPFTRHQGSDLGSKRLLEAGLYLED